MQHAQSQVYIVKKTKQQYKKLDMEWHTAPVNIIELLGTMAHRSCKHLTCTCDYTGIAQEGIIGEGQPGTSKVKCAG